jgi:proteasome alpha subunit
MTMPVYVSPEQLMKDRADYARKGIARGRSVVVLSYDSGIAFVADNPRALHKISEIYDRIAFAAVGKYNEFENLRVAGVRYADLRGYSYDRTDVTARGLANVYAQTLGSVFTTEPKPFEVELTIAEVGATQAADQIYRISYDGSVADVDGFVAMGGQADQIQSALGERWREGLSLSEALVLAVELLAPDPNSAAAAGAAAPAGSAAPAAPAEFGPGSLEVAVLDRQRPRRAFRRLGGTLLERLLSPGDPTSDVPPTDDARPGIHDTLTGNDEASTGTLAEPPAVPPPADG